MTAVDGRVEDDPSSGAFSAVPCTLPAGSGCTRSPHCPAAGQGSAAVTIPSRGPSPRLRSRPAAATLLLLAVLLCTLPAAAAGDAAARVDARRALQVQAAYLVNFLRYSEWPDRPPAGAPMLVSVIGDDQVVETVAAVAEVAAPIHGHGVQVRGVDPHALGPGAHPRQAEVAAARLRDSHLVFLDSGSGVRAGDVIGLVNGTPVLTVSNLEGFLAEGGMIELYAFGRNIVFGANPQAIQDSGVLLSARVLKLARPLAEGVD